MITETGRRTSSTTTKKTDKRDLLFLGGFMGAGKTSVGRELSNITGRPFLDLDSMIEARTGRTVPHIFEQEGEKAFRNVESDTLKEVSILQNCIISLGGGTLLREDNRRIIEESGTLVILDTKAETVRKRLSGSCDRPLLKGASLEKLWNERRNIYRGGDLHVETDHREVGSIAREIISVIPSLVMEEPHIEPVSLKYPDCKVIVGYKLLEDLNYYMNGETPFIVSDTLTGSLYSSRLGDNKGLAMLPRGENAKTLSQISGLYSLFADAELDRSDVIVALGGGCVGDPAGFAAATWMRGIDIIQCPTTLLAQIDSSIGGKTGVNLPEGKNLAGAFHQPKLVLCDVSSLATLSEQDYRQGLAEMVKYGLGEDRSFLAWIEANTAGLRERNPEVLVEAISRCARIKMNIVAEDEKEAGSRARLNLGHTVAHALETSSDYRWQHGDAVSAGMVVAAYLGSRIIGCCSLFQVERLITTLKKLGLTTWPDAEWDDILPSLKMDKKFRAGMPRLIIPCREGKAAIRDDITLDELRDSYEEILKWGRV